MSSKTFASRLDIAVTRANGLTVSPVAGGNYHEPIELDPSQSPNIYGPLAREAAFMDVPLFGPDKPNMNTGFRESFQEMSMSDSVPGVAEQSKLSKVLSAPVPLAEKLQTMRLLWRKQSLSLRNGTMSTNPEPVARQQRHDEFLMETQKLAKLSRKAEEIIDHIMLLRAKERYLFEFARNQQVVSDDCWLQDVWAWVAGESDVSLMLLSATRQL